MNILIGFVLAYLSMKFIPKKFNWKKDNWKRDVTIFLSGAVAHYISTVI